MARYVRRIGQRVKIEIEKEQAVDEALELVRRNKAQLVSVNPVKQTLEEYFVKEVTSS